MPPSREPIAPVPSQNQVDAKGPVSADSEAKRIWGEYRSQRRARRELELIWELLLIHIDGSGDAQWATIYENARVEIPRTLSEYRKTENILRSLVRNAVAYHTTVPLNYFAESPSDRGSRERAMIDSIWANHLAHHEGQDFNSLFATAMALANPAGFCTVHGFWVETPDSWGTSVAPDAVSNPMGAFQMPSRGKLDCFVGNPWDTTFDIGATRRSWRQMRYLRLLPGDEVRKFFDHIPQARGLEGSRRIPSASEFQRIARNWLQGSLGVHGRPLLMDRRDSTKGGELMAVLFEETAPRTADDPGRLKILAIPGYVDVANGKDEGYQPVMIADQPLPGGDFSAEIFYSDERGTDVHSRPWPENLDQQQVDLNLTLSYEWEQGRKQAEAPIMLPGGALNEDMTEIGGYNVMEFDPALGNVRPRAMEWPQNILEWLGRKSDRLRQTMYTLGGYQAVSRGEAPGSRTAYRAILALQQADRTIHGPVNIEFQASAVGFMRRMHRQMATYGDVPWLVNLVGDDYGYLVDPYIDKTKLSKEPPRYRLVNQFGSSPEILAQEILQLAQFKGADGQPFLTTEEARRAYPYRMLFDAPGDPRAVQRRRARTVASYAHTLASRYRELTGFDEKNLPIQWQTQAIQQIGNQLAFVGIVVPDPMNPAGGKVVEPGLEQRFQRRRDDDLAAHLAAYTEVGQDETADPLARAMLTARAELYYLVQQQLAMQSAAPNPEAPSGPAGRSPEAGAREELAAGRENVNKAQRRPPQASGEGASSETTSVA